MNLQEFKDSLNNDTPPAGVDLALQALWYEAKGNWDTAHNIAQEKDDKIGAWVHAYLHRREGDNWNADYWYRRAGKTMPNQTLDEEWANIVETLLLQQ